jgi:hypothetical protein
MVYFDLGAVSATMAPSMVLGPLAAVTTSVSSSLVAVDWANALEPSSRPPTSALEARNAFLVVMFETSPV